MVFRSFCAFARDPAVRSLTQKIQANLDYCFVWRREETRRMHLARPRTQAREPPLTDSSLTAKRRAEALQVVFFQIQSPALSRSDVAAVCTLV